jgi:hypothetical protein
MQFYRVYHIDSHGNISSLTNFEAADDATACEQATGLMRQQNSPGVEVWQCDRQVHCAGLRRSLLADLFDPLDQPGSLAPSR